MDKGVIILCMKNAHYACAAFNLANSIKYHSPNIHITLLSDGIHNKAFSGMHFSQFDSIKEIKERTVTEAKLSVNKYSDYTATLYIDADSICTQPLEPLFAKLKGNKFKSNVIANYTQWTSESVFKEFFKLDFGQTINSSWIYFESSKVFNSALNYYKRGFDITQISPKWGTQLPDEMFFNASLTKNEVDAKVDFDVMFFDEKNGELNFSDICQKYFFITFYGNKNNTRIGLQEWYDRELQRISTQKGFDHRFKLHDILANKLVMQK